jgi:dethiobiotin synthetase
VEGSGGLMSPLSDEDYSATLAEEFGYRLVVVAANRLGVINHSLQTLITAAAFGEGLEIAGVILNQLRSESDESILTNHKQLEERIGVPILADVAWQAKHFEPEIDWFALASQNC